MTTPDLTPVEPRPIRPGWLPIDPVLAEYSVAHVAHVMGVTERSVQRWRRNGVNGYAADKLAVKVCGVTPHVLWGREWALSFDKLAA